MTEAAVKAVRGPWLNRRRRTLCTIGLGAILLAGIFVWGSLLGPDDYGPNYSARYVAPCAAHPFGTDSLGRDMFFRVVAGLSLSIRIGLLAAVISSVIALVLGACPPSSAAGRTPSSATALTCAWACRT